MYSYLKCIVYDRLLKPRQSFLITLYFCMIVQIGRCRMVGIANTAMVWNLPLWKARINFTSQAALLYLERCFCFPPEQTPDHKAVATL